MKKHTIHLSLEFSITIDETKIPAGELPDKDEQAYHERQKRLLEIIRSDKEQEQAYLLYHIAAYVGAMTWQEWDDIILGDRSDNVKNVIQPSLEKLDAADREFFEEAEELNIFHENVQGVYDCFTTDLEGAEIVVEVVE